MLKGRIKKEFTRENQRPGCTDRAPGAIGVRCLGRQSTAKAASDLASSNHGAGVGFHGSGSAASPRFTMSILVRCFLPPFGPADREWPVEPSARWVASARLVLRKAPNWPYVSSDRSLSSLERDNIAVPMSRVI